MKNHVGIGLGVGLALLSTVAIAVTDYSYSEFGYVEAADGRTYPYVVYEPTKDTPPAVITRAPDVEWESRGARIELDRQPEERALKAQSATAVTVAAPSASAVPGRG